MKNRMQRNGLVIALMLMGSWSAQTQITFYEQYSNNGYDYGQGITQTEDSSYIVTGSSSSFTNGPSQAFLLKTDSLGNFKWSKHYGGAESEWGRRVMYIENFGIFMAGYTNSFGNGAYDFYLVKTDTDGNQEWDATFGTSGWERVLDAALTRDSGVIMVGETTNTMDGMADIYIVRTDKNGVELWSQQLGGSGDDMITTIESFDDTTFILGGTTYVEDSLMQKAYVLKIHEDGTVLWEDSLGTNGSYHINDLTILNNEINIVGTLYLGEDIQRNSRIKLDAFGDVIYEWSDVNEGLEEFVGIAHFGSSDKFLCVSSYENEFSYGGRDLAIFNFHNALYWEGNQGGINYAQDDVFGEIVRTSDFGNILVGYVHGVGGSNVFLMKIGANSAFISSNDDFSTNPLVEVSETDLDWGSVFPNPADQEVNLVINEPGVYAFQLLDNQGNLIQQGTVMHDAVLNLSAVKQGVYFLYLNNEEQVAAPFITKLVVIH